MDQRVTVVANRSPKMKKPLQPDSRPSFLPRYTTLQGRYRIVKRLGSGGMGAVYEAIDRRLNITVALKESFASDHRLRRQFAREARLLAKLNHPALPRVTDYFTESSRVFLVMQFIPGPDLAEIISRQRGPFPRQEVIGWADQILEALIYLHSPEHQIVHRDIKPHNLKIRASGQIALLDFGLAKSDMTESSVNSRRSVFGFSRRYSPPEQIQDLGTTPRSDIYALGATLYYLFTGVKPPDAMTRATTLAEGKPDPLRPAHEVYAEVGADIAIVLNRAMALNPDDRCGSAEEFRDGLLRVDYSRWATANEFALAVPPQTVNTVSVSTTVAAVKQPDPPPSEPRKIVIDNFFSTNSVFSGESSSFPSPLLPEPNRMPFLACAIFAFMLIGFLGVRYDWADTLLGTHVDDAKQESVLTAGDKPLDQRRTYTYDAKPSKKTGVSGGSRPAPRRNEKRVNHR
jgi:serine/threonine protein kinase